MKIFVAPPTNSPYVSKYNDLEVTLPFLMAAYVRLAKIALKGRQRL